jgi:D-alanyl-lipoteichoic acid acyltransferase DltB (MBOAT superfamily)
MFLDRIGVYDVILPFLLVFTIMYAILEKTRVLGEDISPDGKLRYTKKNLNSIVAFVIAFFVIASAKLVALINEAMGNVVILVLVGVSTLMLLGVFEGTQEIKFKEGSWQLIFFIIFMILGVLLIFLHAVQTSDGEPLLDYIYNYMSDNWDSEAVSSLILVGLISLFIWAITRGNPSTGTTTPPATPPRP